MNLQNERIMGQRFEFTEICRCLYVVNESQAHFMLGINGKDDLFFTVG